MIIGFLLDLFKHFCLIFVLLHLFSISFIFRFHSVVHVLQRGARRAQLASVLCQGCRLLCKDTFFLKIILDTFFKFWPAVSCLQALMTIFSISNGYIGEQTLYFIKWLGCIDKEWLKIALALHCQVYYGNLINISVRLRLCIYLFY